MPVRDIFKKQMQTLSECIKRDPHNPLPYLYRANLSLVQHKDEQARADLDKALRLPRRDIYVLSAIAWLRATSPDTFFRDGREAVQAARRACDLTKWKDLGMIDTLAAAYAETGDFDRAITYEKRAMQAFSGDVLKETEKRLASYREHKPYREDLARAMMSDVAEEAAQQAQQAARRD
jgi:tetratricopeptide (TPR) repeat protein